jgi:putative tributyrin esterase
MFRTFEASDPTLSPPNLRFVTVKSAALGQRADVLIFMPPQAAALRDVPVVLLLHGVYGSHWAWAYQGGAHLTAQRLIDTGAIPPLVLAMPSDGLWGDGSGYVAHRTQDFERWIVEEVPAATRTACSSCSEASPLCIAGLSMGGFAALRLAGRHPQRFVAAAGHSSVTDAAQLDVLLAETREGWAAAPADTRVIDAWRATDRERAPPTALRFDCGRADPFLAANRRLHDELQAGGIPHEYAEHDGGHDWAYWSRHVDDTLRFFGRALTTRTTTS